jgi:hypothetical protein
VRITHTSPQEKTDRRSHLGSRDNASFQTLNCWCFDIGLPNLQNYDIEFLLFTDYVVRGILLELRQSPQENASVQTD